MQIWYDNCHEHYHFKTVIVVPIKSHEFIDDEITVLRIYERKVDTCFEWGRRWTSFSSGLFAYLLYVVGILVFVFVFSFSFFFILFFHLPYFTHLLGCTTVVPPTCTWLLVCVPLVFNTLSSNISVVFPFCMFLINNLGCFESSQNHYSNSNRLSPSIFYAHTYTHTRTHACMHTSRTHAHTSRALLSERTPQT